MLSATAAADALARGAGPAGESGRLRLLAAWLAWVVGLNGGTLAFNSAYDRDTEGIAYLPHPPLPPAWLARTALALMLAGAALAWWTQVWFGAITTACVGLSVLYSHPATRWKGVPGLDLAVNMVGYGGGTTLAGLLVGQVAFRPAAFRPAAFEPAPPGADGWWLAAAFTCLFGSFYPLTQLYQLEADRRRGDRTLASELGARRSLWLALGLGAGAAACFAAATSRWGARLPLLLGGALALWLGHLVWWAARAGRMDAAAQERGMYRALAIWALIDLALVAQRYGAGWVG
jgi:1,4-dihydroxy-2-naphthoate octaprenyltransferase